MDRPVNLGLFPFGEASHLLLKWPVDLRGSGESQRTVCCSNGAVSQPVAALRALCVLDGDCPSPVLRLTGKRAALVGRYSAGLPVGLIVASFCSVSL